MANYVPGTGSLSPKLMIVGEAPGKLEDELRRPFVGPTGELLNDFLFKAGINRAECYVTNVVKYRPPFNDFEKLHLVSDEEGNPVNLENQIENLWNNEIRALKPNCILAVGDRALQAITGFSGILNYRGSILKAKDGVTKVVPTIHPAALFGKDDKTGETNKYKSGLPWTYTKLIQSDISRAYEESQSKELSLPDRTLQIAHSSLDLYRFFREYSSLTNCATDIESINCVPVCIGFSFNRHHAISVPLIRNIGNYPLTDMGNNELDEVWRMVDEQLRRISIIGQNFMYDEYKLGLIGFQTPHILSDTLIKCRVIFPELPKKRLNDLASLWTREPFYKEEGKEFRPGKDKIDRLLLYNAKDCAVNFEVDEKMEEDLLSMSSHWNIPLKEYFYDYQMKKHKLYLRMQNTGMKVDLAKKAELKRIYTDLWKTVHDKITAAVGEEVNVASPPQMYKLLYKTMRFKYLKGSGPAAEETLVRLLGNHCKGNKTQYKPILEDVLEEKRIRSQLSKVINFTPDYDDRCRSTFNIISTETTRSSTGVLKAPLRPKKMKIGLGFHTIPKHGRLAKDIRSMLIVDKGKVMVQIDASQAEPRVVGVLSKDWKLLEAFDNKVDIHRRTAGLLFGYSNKLYLEPDYKNPAIDDLEKDSPERFTGKTVRNAGNYDTKKHTLMETFNTNAQKFGINMSISEWKAGKMLEQFHDESPNIKNVFHKEVQEAIDYTGVLIDPFGGIRVFNGKKQDEATYREGYANIPQRTVAHVVQGAMLKCFEEWGDQADILWLSENHDAFTIEAPANDWERYARLMKQHVEIPVDFSTYCTLKRDYKLIIPGEVEISDTNLKEMRKVKL